MKSSSVSSIYKVYNDKEMASEYSDYTTTIKKWETETCRIRRTHTTRSSLQWRLRCLNYRARHLHYPTCLEADKIAENDGKIKRESDKI